MSTYYTLLVVVNQAWDLCWVYQGHSLSSQ